MPEEPRTTPPAAETPRRPAANPPPPPPPALARRLHPSVAFGTPGTPNAPLAGVLAARLQPRLVE